MGAYPFFLKKNPDFLMGKVKKTHIVCLWANQAENLKLRIKFFYWFPKGKLHQQLHPNRYFQKNSCLLVKHSQYTYSPLFPVHPSKLSAFYFSQLMEVPVILMSHSCSYFTYLSVSLASFITRTQRVDNLLRVNWKDF